MVDLLDSSVACSCSRALCLVRQLPETVEKKDSLQFCEHDVPGKGVTQVLNEKCWEYKH